MKIVVVCDVMYSDTNKKVSGNSPELFVRLKLETAECPECCI
jgi:hypothetical protein